MLPSVGSEQSYLQQEKYIVCLLYRSAILRICFIAKLYGDLNYKLKMIVGNANVSEELKEDCQSKQRKVIT